MDTVATCMSGILIPRVKLLRLFGRNLEAKNKKLQWISLRSPMNLNNEPDKPVIGKDKYGMQMWLQICRARRDFKL